MPCVRSLLTVIFLALLPLAAQAAWYWPFGDDGIDYTIRFDGADDEMTHWFAKLKLDQPPDANPPQNEEELEQEANTLAARVKKALDAKGYVESHAEPQVEKATPPVVQITVTEGARYPLHTVTLDWQGAPLQAVDIAVLKSKTGEPLDMLRIEEDAETLTKLIGKNACLLSLSVAPKLQLTSETRNADLIFVVTHGPRANFGPSAISGNERVRNSVIDRGVTWKEGQCFDVTKVDETRAALIGNQLFSRVDITPSTAVDAKGEAPVSIAVKERVPRTIGAGIDYSTDIGAGIHGSWEHRNLWGDAEKLTTAATLAEREQKLSGTLRMPAFQRDDQVLSLSTAFGNQDTDAYKALTFDNSALVERKLNKHLTVSTGLGYKLAHTEDVQHGKEDYALASIPSYLEYDSRNNVLDARKGLFAHVAATPYTETLGDGGQFLKMLATGQTYISSDAEKPIKYDPTLALRLSVGSIQGGKGVAVPADTRFYAGGGGSVRGYSYQSLSPQFNGSPIGGASLIESSAELRLHLTPTFGAVIFTDAGNAYATSTPDLSENIYYSAGVGARYYSPVGPLRFDIAFPLNGADIGETGYQFYVSLGQSF